MPCRVMSCHATPSAYSVWMSCASWSCMCTFHVNFMLAGSDKWQVITWDSQFRGLHHGGRARLPKWHPPSTCWLTGLFLELPWSSQQKASWHCWGRSNCCASFAWRQKDDWCASTRPCWSWSCCAGRPCLAVRYFGHRVCPELGQCFGLWGDLPRRVGVQQKSSSSPLVVSWECPMWHRWDICLCAAHTQTSSSALLWTQLSTARTSRSVNTVNGRLSQDALRLADTAFFEAVREGVVWEIIPSWVALQLPWLPDILQQVGNTSLNRGESEIQMLQQLHSMCVERTSKEERVNLEDVNRSFVCESLFCLCCALDLPAEVESTHRPSYVTFVV